MTKKMKMSKGQPTSSQVHVPTAGEEQKLLKKDAPKKADDSRQVGKVALIREGKILLGTRSDNGHYDFPGGRAKFGEDILAGTIREVHEETGIELDPQGLQLIGYDSIEKNDKEKIIECYAYLADLDETPPLSESEDHDDEMATLEWVPMDDGLPEDVVDNMHTPLERNIVLQSIGMVQKDIEPEEDEQTEQSDAICDLQDAQELISGIDWEVEQENVDPLTAREMAENNLEQDPLFYRKKRLQHDRSADPLYKDTEQSEQSQFAGEGYDEQALQNGFMVDLGSGNCRESGHIGLDVYPYDYGTAIHDLDTGLPFGDGSVSKVRMANVLGEDNLSDPKALLSEIHRVLMPGGQFTYEGPEDIHNYPEWTQDYPGLVLTDHQDDCKIDKADGPNLYRQKFTRVATPDPATANDAEPRIGVAQYDMLPADALLSMDATGYYWSDSTSSGRGNRLMGYPSQGGLLNKDNEGSASSATESNHLLSEQSMFKGGPGSGRHPEGGGKDNHGAGKSKEYITTNIQTVWHSTDNSSPAISHKEERLIPHSISTSPSEDNVWGKNTFKGSLEKGSKILEINVHNFNREKTPIQIGKDVQKYASKNGFDAIKILNIPQIGTEFAILNPSKIKWSKKASFLNKGGPGSGRIAEGGDKLQESKQRASQSINRLNEARRNYQNAPHDKKDQASANIKQALVEHQAHMNDLSYHSSVARQTTGRQAHVHNSISKVSPILKAAPMQQVVYCVVLEPDTADSQDDVMTSEDIEKTAHNYLIRARLIGSGHEKAIEAAPVESFIAPQDLEYQGQNGPQVVKKGSWIIGIKVFDPSEWQKVVNGEYTGVSVGGKGLRDEI